MTTVKVFYGSSGGNTRNAAEAVAAELSGEAIDIATAKPADFDADLIILGTSTWGIGELQDDWADSISVLDHVEWDGRKIALFGLGDQSAFGDTFVDGMRIIYDRVGNSATLVGRWDSNGYQHSASIAEEDGRFLGLALDDDNQPEQTPERISQWCRQLRDEAEL